jgi:hypothetical protein
MTVQRITRFVFWLDGVVVSQSSEHQIQPGMADVFDALQHRFELWLISSYPSPQLADVISKNSLSLWFDDGAVYSLPSHNMGHREMLQWLVVAGVVEPGKSLWIDHDPIRTMLAVRQGIDASIFVDAERLCRDLALWGIISPD